MSDSCAPEAPDHFLALGRNVKALMVWPTFPNSFWSLRASMPIFGRGALAPPLGLVTIAALCPAEWSLRLIDQSVEELRDSDILWADLVMVSGMDTQREGIHDVLARARRLGKRTIVGGPYASAQPEALRDRADHVVVGEPDEVFGRIAHDLETGSAKHLYRIDQKPDISKTPIPRFDLLKADAYLMMSIQFSRGCPFQCEFCDIITIYGRKPRTKSPEQVMAELDALLRLGRGKPVFLVDDNFIGNRKRAVELVTALSDWQLVHGYAFNFLTEASVDLAQCPELMDGMAAANFTHVFIGIESPSKESLAETKKHQNLREDLRSSVARIQSQGLWVMGGFIIGFDSDPEDIFDQQVEFITDAAIPMAMIGMLVAGPTTALYERMVREGRLRTDVAPSDNFALPNFRTNMPPLAVARGYRKMLSTLFAPDAYYQRGIRSLEAWRVGPRQKLENLGTMGILLRSLWYQGVRSSYRRAYWRFIGHLLRHGERNPVRLANGFMILVAGHHFISYASEVVTRLDGEIARLEHEEHRAQEPEPASAI